MHTVKSFATEHGLTRIIERAIGFHPQLEASAEAIWAIPVAFSGSLKTSAGYFWARPNRISLHQALARGARQHLIETFLHELAHAHAYIVYGHVDHSATWWEMMHQLGQKPTRTHSLDLASVDLTRTEQSLEDLGL